MAQLSLLDLLVRGIAMFFILIWPSVLFDQIRKAISACVSQCTRGSGTWHNLLFLVSFLAPTPRHRLARFHLNTEISTFCRGDPWCAGTAKWRQPQNFKTCESCKFSPLSRISWDIEFAFFLNVLSKNFPRSFSGSTESFFPRRSLVMCPRIVGTLFWNSYTKFHIFRESWSPWKHLKLICQ